MKEINTDNGNFNLSFFRNFIDVYYVICNITNKITNTSFEGIEPELIIERKKHIKRLCF